MSRLFFAALFILSIHLPCLADDAAALKKSEDGQKRYEVARQKASDAYWRTMVAADRQAVADLEAAVKLANAEETKQLINKKNAAVAILTADQKSLEEHTIVVTGGSQESPWAANVKPELQKPDVHARLSVGMTLADCDAMESAKGWDRVVSEESTDSITICYSYSTPSSFVERDLCQFKDGKLAKYRPTRLEDALKTAPPGVGRQVSGETFGH